MTLPPFLPLILSEADTKKIAEQQSYSATLMLGYPDSNQEKQDQNLLCYHYTISQFSIVLEATPLLLYCECKGTDFF